MNGLKCTTANCQHNTLCHCLAGIINVNEKAACASKMKRNGGTLSQTFADMEAAELETADLDRLDTLVQCEAECEFNENFKCTRQNILVEDGFIATKCFSRKK